MNEAPLFADALSLAGWLTGRLGDDPRELSRAICRSAQALLEQLTLALKGRDRQRRLAEADVLVIRLQTQLRLAVVAGYLTEEQMLHALERLDQIGRQLGGWRRKLDGAPAQ